MHYDSVENPHAPSPDPSLSTTHYTRNPKQDISLGLKPSSKHVTEDGVVSDAVEVKEGERRRVEIDQALEERIVKASGGETKDRLDEKVVGENQDNDGDDDDCKQIGRQELMAFPTECPSCREMSQVSGLLFWMLKYCEILCKKTFFHNPSSPSNLLSTLPENLKI